MKINGTNTQGGRGRLRCGYTVNATAIGEDGRSVRVYEGQGEANEDMPAQEINAAANAAEYGGAWGIGSAIVGSMMAGRVPSMSTATLVLPAEVLATSAEDDGRRPGRRPEFTKSYEAYQ